MATDQTAGAGPMHVDFRSVREVVVHPEDEDRFLLTAKEAARACPRARNEKELREQFAKLLLFLREWCEKHSGDVRFAYAYPGDGFLNILICTPGDGYRFEFDDTITELDIGLTQQFDWLAAEVMQVPERALEGRTSLEKAILVYGDGSGTRATGSS